MELLYYVAAKHPPKGFTGLRYGSKTQKVIMNRTVSLREVQTVVDCVDTVCRPTWGLQTAVDAVGVFNGRGTGRLRCRQVYNGFLL